MSREMEPWYSVRSVFYDNKNGIYEERTILIRAASHEEAIEKGEKEALEYAEVFDDTVYCRYSDTYHLPEGSIEEGAEIFSITRNTRMSRDEYLDRFLDTKTENRQS